MCFLLTCYNGAVLRPCSFVWVVQCSFLWVVQAWTVQASTYTAWRLQSFPLADTCTAFVAIRGSYGPEALPLLGNGLLTQHHKEGLEKNSRQGSDHFCNSTSVQTLLGASRRGPAAEMIARHLRRLAVELDKAGEGLLSWNFTREEHWPSVTSYPPARVTSSFR